MNRQSKKTSYRIARRAGNQGARRPVSNQAGDLKRATGRINLRKEYRIGTCNVRKTKEAGKLYMVRKEMKGNNIRVLGLSETNWNQRGSFKTNDNYTVIFAGKDSGYSHSVAMILDNNMANCLMGYNPVNERTIPARIHAKPHNIA